MFGRKEFLDKPNGQKKTRYDLLITRWNNLSPMQRQEQARICTTKGHTFEPLSFGVEVCTTCFKYNQLEDE